MEKCEHCGTTKQVEYRINPYQKELYDIEKWEWICYYCYLDSLGDI